MTSLKEELAEQARWRPRAGAPFGKEFRALVENEFMPPERLQEWTSRRLAALLKFAAANVPYYRDLAAEIGVTAEELARENGLRALPALTKHIVQDAGEALQSLRLPRGHQPAGRTITSGTTGRPTVVRQTNLSGSMFNLLKQREYRWFRFDPAGKLASIRTASEFRSRPKGPDNPDGATYRARGWRYVENFFETGPFVGFNITNPMREQLAWLAREKPDYLMSLPSNLENLAYSANGANPAPGLRGLLAIAEQTSAAMRRRIEAGFGMAPAQNYGLTEIGIVASRCEAGRFHVHLEHCLVEIVDEDGRACAPGETGHVLATCLTNFLTPIIRYDTGDLAKVVADPCPCGRSLPAFGPIVGRYWRFAGLPEGTVGRFFAVRFGIEELPPEISRDLRLFQLHHFRDNRFELRLAVAKPLPPEFYDRIRAAWAAACPGEVVPLAIVEVANIAPGPSGKLQEFTSDVNPPLEEDDSEGGD